MKENTGISMMLSLLIVLLAVIAVIGGSSAQSLSSNLGLVTYPSKGQSAQQQDKDEVDCYGWAKQKTGIDPVLLRTRPTKEEGLQWAEVNGYRALLWGRLESSIGAIAGDAGTGAAIGAVGGPWSAE